MTDSDKLSLFSAMFSGLSHTYGTYNPASGRSWQVKRPATQQTMLRHLKGIQPYGVYLLRGHVTSAVVVDFDTHDANHPLEYVHRARHYDLPAYIERSKSKGFHSWTFFESPGVEAGKARALTQHILEEMEAPTTEVFPKQDRIDVSRGQVGNFINAPLFGKLVPEGRTVFVDPNNALEPYPNQWVFLNSVEHVTRRQLDEVLAANDIDPPAHKTCESGVRLGTSQYGRALPPCYIRILEQGVTKNQRVACFLLAVQLERIGLPIDVTVDVLRTSAAKNRPTAGKRIITVAEIESQASFAYRKRYAGCACSSPAVQIYCDENCPIAKKKTVPQ